MSADGPYEIVGGGIAGQALALYLLQAGMPVRLWEQQCGPIDRVCGEGLLPSGVAHLQELGLGEQLQRQGHAFHGLRFSHGPRQAYASFPPGVQGFGIARGLLDQMLRTACAAHSNFERIEGQKFRPQGQQRLFAADGINSHFQPATRKSKRIGIRFRLKTPPEPLVSVYFCKGCEFYLTPSGPDTLSIAVLIDPEQSKQPGAKLRDWARQEFGKIRPDLAQLQPFDLTTRAPIAATRPTGQIHQLGDAWRAFDPICGAGMSFALRCAKAASQHPNDPKAYYQALRPTVQKLQRITELLLWIRGGGLKTKAALQLLASLPPLFRTLVADHLDL